MTKMFDYLRNLAFIDLDAKQHADFKTAHACAMKSGSALPFCNRVCATSGVTAQEVAGVMEFFGSTPFRWFVHDKDAAQINMLETSGLRYMCTFPAMSVDLAGIKPVAYKSGITVKEISEDADIDQWISIVTQAYGITDVPEFTKFIQELRQRAGTTGIIFYCGFYEGKAVAASQILRHGDTVALHWVGTLSEYRHRGVGLAVSLQPLLDAQKNGCETAILFASQSGMLLYEKLGFKEYAKYCVYGVPLL